MLFNEIITEEFVSQAQRGKFYACASGKGHDCGDTSTSKWKRMAGEFEESTPNGKKLPHHVAKNESPNHMSSVEHKLRRLKRRGQQVSGALQKGFEYDIRGEDRDTARAKRREETKTKKKHAENCDCNMCSNMAKNDGGNYVEDESKDISQVNKALEILNALIHNNRFAVEKNSKRDQWLVDLKAILIDLKMSEEEEQEKYHKIGKGPREPYYVQ